jgi:arginine deiminase
MTKGQVLYGSSVTFSFTGPMQATIMGTSTDELTITDSTYTIAPGNIVRLKDRYIYTNATTILNDQGYVTEAATNLGTGSGLFL